MSWNSTEVLLGLIVIVLGFGLSAVSRLHAMIENHLGNIEEIMEIQTGLDFERRQAHWREQIEFKVHSK